MCLASLLWPGIPLLSSHTYAHNMSGEDVCIPWIFSFWLAFTMQASTALEAQQMFEAQRTSDDAMKAGRTVGSVPAPSPAVLLRIRLHQSIYVAMSSPSREFTDFCCAAHPLQQALPHPASAECYVPSSICSALEYRQLHLWHVGQKMWPMDTKR
jgi:hypothetical protein